MLESFLEKDWFIILISLWKSWLLQPRISDKEFIYLLMILPVFLENVMFLSIFREHIRMQIFLIGRKPFKKNYMWPFGFQNSIFKVQIWIYTEVRRDVCVRVCVCMQKY